MRPMKLTTSRSFAQVLCSALTCLAVGLTGCTQDMGKAIERAKAARAKGDNATAEIELRTALADHPKDAAGLFLVGQVLAEMGNLLLAENSLTRALEYGYPAPEVLPVLGRVLLELEKFPEALQVLGQAIKPDAPTLPEIAVLRGRAHLAMGSLAEATTQFRVAENIRPVPGAKLGLAQVSMAENDLPTAEKLINEVIAADPKNVDAYMLRADLLRVLGRMDEALASFRQAVTLEPSNTAALFALATLEVAAERFDAARPLLERGERLAPHSPKLHFAKALLAYKQKRNRESIAELQKLAKMIPEHYPGLLLAGMAQYADGKYDQAQNALGSYLQRFPGDLAARRMLGATLLAKGQPHLTMNVFQPVLALTQDVGILAVAAEATRLMGRLGDSRSLLQRAIALDPKNAGLRTNLALTDMASGARQRAIAGLETAISLTPPDTRADEALIMMLLGAKQIERAEKVSAALEQRLPKAATTYMLRGAVQLVKKDLVNARASMELALKMDPGHLNAAEALADIDAMEKKPDSRRQRLEAIIKHDPHHFGALLALAKLELAQGRHSEGVSAIRRALAEHPQSINALLMLADAQFRQGQVAEAQISARQAHQLHPNDTRAIAILAEAQLAGGDKAGAIVTLAKLTALQPQVVSGYLRLASAYIAVGDMINAKSTVLSALKQEPKDAGARALLADIYLQTGQLAEASSLGLQVQREQPQSALGYRIEGDVLLARKDYARAGEAFKKAAAIQMNGALVVRMHQAQRAGGSGTANDGPVRAWVAKHPEDTETRFYLADVLNETGRYKEAAEIYTEVLKREPNSGRALNNLAWALHAAGDRRSLEYARQAVQLYPNSAEAVDTLGWILVQQGNHSEGVPNLLKAVTLDANNPEIRYHLVEALMKIGDTRRAKIELKTLLSSNKPFPQMAEARALAARLGP